MATPVGFSLVKRATAERLGARLVMMSGRPSLYISRRIPVVDGTQPYGPSSVHHSGSLLVPDVADTDPSAPVERIAFEATSHGP